MGDATVRAARSEAIREALASLVRDGKPVSFAEIARMVGISPAAIHNRYKVEAQKIREAAGLVSDPEVQRLRDQVAQLIEEKREHVKTIDELRALVTSLASVNEALRRQRAIDVAVASGKVTRLGV
jgi:DNA-binding Lrp family transcriptional regulator